MAKGQYEELMERYLTNQVTEEERIRIDAWLDMLVDTKTRDLELSPQEKEELYQKIISKQPNVEEIISYRPESLKKLRRRTWTTRIAASVTIALIVAFGAFKIMRNGNDSSHNNTLASQEIKKIILQDGTIVWAHADAMVAYYQNASERHVQMSGQALFEVAKNPAVPFIIKYEEVTIKVYGTSFSVKTGEQVEVKVLTGKVRITTSADSTGLIVVKDEQVIYTTEKGLQKMSLPMEDAKLIVKNTGYDMFFDNATLGTVITQLEKKFDVKFELENPHIADCHVKTNMTDNSLEDSLKKIAAILHVEYKIDGSVIKLTGTGCN